MNIRAFLSDLVVPGLVLVGTALFWFSVREAPSISQRVPLGVIVFILVMTVIVVLRAALVARTGPVEPVEPLSHCVPAWLEDWGQRLAFVALSVGYYFAFSTLGFSLANLGFLIAALVVAGYASGRAPRHAALRILGIALVATVVFHFLANAMEFNVPRGPLGL